MRGWKDPLFDYITNFIYGGFFLCIVGPLAPTVKRGVKNFKFISVLILLVLLVSWCGYRSFPRYSYCYQVIVQSSEDLNDLELYLPLGTVAQQPYTEIYDHPFLSPQLPTQPATGLEAEYHLEIIDTEYGEMLKLGIPGLVERYKPDEETSKLGPKPPMPVDIALEPYHYDRSIIFDMSNPWGISHVPHERLQFLPKYNVRGIEVVYSEQLFIGSIRVRAREVVEQFNVPLKVTSGKETELEIWLSHY